VTTAPVRVLIVDDEPITADAHAEYVRRIPGFEVAGIALTASAAIKALRGSLEPRHGRGSGGASPGRIDLILLDMNLPDVHGLELCRRIRTAGIEVDVFAITAVREVSVVRAAVSLGIVAYLIKPFRFSTFIERLESYLAYRQHLTESGGLATQHDVDATLASLRPAGATTFLDKGIARETLAGVVRELRRADGALSASEVGLLLQLSRVTARRYLEHLADTEPVSRQARYGSPGRPEIEYRWATPKNSLESKP
jgi:response regulator of citrate/malate metabolism